MPSVYDMQTALWSTIISSAISQGEDVLPAADTSIEATAILKSFLERPAIAHWHLASALFYHFCQRGATLQHGVYQATIPPSPVPRRCSPNFAIMESPYAEVLRRGFFEARNWGGSTGKSTTLTHAAGVAAQNSLS